MVAGNMADDRSTDASVLRVNPRNNSDSAITILSKRNVAYIFNEEYMRLCDELPKVKNRVRIDLCLWTMRKSVMFSQQLNKSTGTSENR